MGRGKRKRIVAAVRRAQKAGRAINSTKMAMCHGKVRYLSYKLAKQRVEGMVDATVYPCHYCEFYHIGRKPWK